MFLSIFVNSKEIMILMSFLFHAGAKRTVRHVAYGRGCGTIFTLLPDFMYQKSQLLYLSGDLGTESSTAAVWCSCCIVHTPAAPYWLQTYLNYTYFINTFVRLYFIKYETLDKLFFVQSDAVFELILDLL